MTNNIDRVKSLWTESFNETESWIDGFFRDFYREDTLDYFENDGEMVCSLLRIPYRMNFQWSLVPMGYIMGACTRKDCRKKGWMEKLLRNSLIDSYENGDLFMALIPRDRPLYFYYDKFDFATVFYIKEDRYTSMHNFHGSGEFTPMTGLSAGLLDSFVRKIEEQMANRVVHSLGDLAGILWDLKEDGGKVVAVGDTAVRGVAFVIPKEGEVVVRECLTVDDEKVLPDLLQAVKNKYPEFDMVIERTPKPEDRALEARGMLRIINVKRVLEKIATHHRALRQAIKIKDSLIPQNNHIFIIDNGLVVENDDWKGKIDNEMDIKTLAEVLFNTSATGSLFGLPAHRPSMSLMMD